MSDPALSVVKKNAETMMAHAKSTEVALVEIKQHMITMEKRIGTQELEIANLKQVIGDKWAKELGSGPTV